MTTKIIVIVAAGVAAVALHAIPLGWFGGIFYHLRQIKTMQKINLKIVGKSRAKYDILRTLLCGGGTS